MTLRPEVVVNPSRILPIGMAAGLLVAAVFLAIDRNGLLAWLGVLLAAGANADQTGVGPTAVRPASTITGRRTTATRLRIRWTRRLRSLLVPTMAC